MDLRQPPQDLEAEQSLLGCLLIDAAYEFTAAVLEIIPRARADFFARVDHRMIFKVAIDLFMDKKPMDLIVMEDELRKRNELESVGGRDYLIELVRSVGSSVHAEHYARIIREKAILRDIIARATHAITSAHEPGADPVKLQAEVVKEMSDIGTESSIQPDRPASEIFADMLDLIESGEIATGLNFELIGIDDYASMLPGDLVVISARPAKGKSVLSLQIAHDIACRGTRVGYLTLEMLPEDLAMRLAQRFTGISSRQLRRGQYGQVEGEALRYVRIPDTLHIAHDAPGTSVDVAAARAIGMCGRHGIKVFVVDYAQQLGADVRKSDNRTNEVAAVVRGLKAVAMRMKIPVIAVAQLNRDVDKSAGRRPRLSDLAESAELEKAASIIIAIHYPNESDDDDDALECDVELVVLKNRNGECVVAKYVFDRRFLEFRKSGLPRVLPPEPVSAHASAQKDW